MVDLGLRPWREVRRAASTWALFRGSTENLAWSWGAARGTSRRMLKKEGRRCSPGADRLGVLIPRKESNAMKTNITTATALPPAVLSPVGKAMEEVSASFDRFCLAAGMEALGEMMEKDAADACGPRHSRAEARRGYRWGRTRGKVGFHAGKIDVERPRVRDFAGRELVLASWEHAMAEDWLGKWAMNLMLLNVSTRKFRRAVRLPEGDVPAPAGSGVSKSAASRHFVALSAGRLREWLAADLSGLDLLVVQIDGIHIAEHLILVAAIGIDAQGIKHPLALIEGATENAAIAQALIDDLIERGLDPAVPRLFIIGGRESNSCSAITFPSPRRSLDSKNTGRRVALSGAEVREVPILSIPAR